MITKPIHQADQTPLDDPIKVRFTGKLRTRIQERHGDHTDWGDNLSGDNQTVRVYRTLSREKTNVVCETVEEAEAFIDTMDWYTMGGIHWMNGSMANCARRVKNATQEALER